MADRSRRVRRQISDMTEDSSDESQSESGEDWAQRMSAPARNSGRYDSSASATPSNVRPKRTAATGSANSTSSATIHRSTSGSPNDQRQSIKLTVKVPPSKLREVMRANEVESLQDVLGGGRVLDGPRSRRAATVRKAEKPRYAEYGESDIEDEEDDGDMDEPEEEEDDEEQEEQEEENALEEIGEAEGDTDEDEEMQDISPPKQRAPPAPATPKITLKAPSNARGEPLSKPRLIVTPAQVGPLEFMEDQEMEDDPGDEEENSSELSEGDEGEGNDEDEEGDEEMEDEEDAEGEDEEIEDDVDGDSSDETPASGMATPDIAKMTKRQRGTVDEGALLALDMAPQQRKFFTDQEKAMKKDEHARKRKELTKRKIQEEKAAALNRLLKPQASKARGAAPKPENLAAAAAAAGSQGDEEEYYWEKPNALYTRWTSTKDGIKLGVPEEWLGKKIGKCFGPVFTPSNGSLIRELD